MKINTKGFIILSVTIIVLVGVVFYWYHLQFIREIAPVSSVQNAPQEQDQSLGATIYDSASNPVAGAESNALEDSGSNPFDGYTNPFEN